ncbi:insulinase family protein [Alistipes sp. OttesenSCG-928-B03]|nr:insulinase family protein [Alistipes sp. OttesenSCG-928-B03]
MIKYREHRLPNGLWVLVNRDSGSQMAAVNIVYKVGARNENPERTGFAHLFEHLMFRGTRQVPHFDIPVQLASGENNAFTNNDYTDYYITLPKENIETALWLESDRMTGLDITPEALEAEKKVVIEEYNQRYLNQPYGDQLMLLRDMAYKAHPYRWATIGLSIDHIAGATLDEVRGFYDKWYTPSNAILSISADLPEEEMIALAEKWFADIAGHDVEALPLPVEPEQTEARRLEVERDVPAESVTIAFKMAARTHPEFFHCDLISDVLAGGTSSRLYQRLVKEKQIFSAVNAFVTGDLDPGLFILTGHLHPGISTAEGEQALWNELHTLQNEPVSDYELEKVKNKFESGTLFGELNVMNKAMNLGFYKMQGDMSLLNGEVAIFRAITAQDVIATSRRVFVPEHSSTLVYHIKE